MTDDSSNKSVFGAPYNSCNYLKKVGFVCSFSLSHLIIFTPCFPGFIDVYQLIIINN